jgi:hypothetical protein
VSILPRTTSEPSESAATCRVLRREEDEKPAAVACRSPKPASWRAIQEGAWPKAGEVRKVTKRNPTWRIVVFFVFLKD